MAINLIEAGYRTPAPGDNADLAAIFDKMAEIEKRCLGFLGLTESFGVEIPETFTLHPPSPTVLHYPAKQGVLITTPFLGSRVGGHPGGKQQHEHIVEIAVLVGTRAENSVRLINKSLRDPNWLRAITRTYAANPQLDGLVKGIEVGEARWGSVAIQARSGTIAPTLYFGWIFSARITAQYLIQTGG